MEEQAAVVQIHRPHRGEAVVHHEVLGVNEAGGVLIDAHPRLQQGRVVGPGDLEHIPLVRDVGGDDPHIHPGLGRVAQGGVGGHVDDQIGGGDIDILPGFADHVQIDRLAHRLPVQGGVGVGLDIAGPGAGGGGLRAEVVELLLPAAAVVPHGEEHHRHGPNRVPLQQDGAVLPVAEALPPVDILVSQVDASGEAHLSVDDQEFPVVPVVEAQGHHRHKAVEHPALDAPGGHLLVIVPGEGEHAAHVVVDEAHLHPLGGLLLQDLQHAVPEDAGLDDEVLQEDVPLRLPQLLQHPGKDQIPHREILGLRVGVGGAVGEVLQVPGLAGGVLPQGEQVVRLEVLPQVLLRLLGDALHPAAGALGDLSAAHQQIEDAPEHGEGEHQQQPGDLIGGLHAAPHDQQGGRHAQKDKKPVQAGGVLRKEAHHQHQRHHLRDQGQAHKYRTMKQDIQQFLHCPLTFFPRCAGVSGSDQLGQGTENTVPLQEDGPIAGAAGPGVHHPQAVLQLLAVGPVGVAEEENVHAGLPGLRNGQVIAPLHPPQVAVGQQDVLPLEGDPLDGGGGGPAVAVAGDHADGERLEAPGQLLRVAHQVAQMDDLVGLLLLDGLDHAGEEAVGVGKNKDLHIVTLPVPPHILKRNIRIGVNGICRVNIPNSPPPPKWGRPWAGTDRPLPTWPSPGTLRSWSPC